MVFGLGDPTLRADNTATIVVNDAAPGTILAGFNANGRAFNATEGRRARSRTPRS